MNARLLFLLSTVESDSHTWNLTYLQLFLEERDIEVINLGPCVSHQETIDAIEARQPDAVVISSVNGHGLRQGKALVAHARASLGSLAPAFVIGGKLTTDASEHEEVRKQLLSAGYDEVFVGNDSIEDFRLWLGSFRVQPLSLSMRSAPRCTLPLRLRTRVAVGERDLSEAIS